MGLNNSKRKTKNSKKSKNNEKNQNFKSENKTRDDQLKMLQKLFLNASSGARVLNFQEYVQLFINLNPSLINTNFILIAENEFLNLDTDFDGYIRYIIFISFFYKFILFDILVFKNLFPIIILTTKQKNFKQLIIT
jgi:hypothetical protein